MLVSTFKSNYLLPYSEQNYVNLIDWKFFPKQLYFDSSSWFSLNPLDNNVNIFIRAPNLNFDWGHPLGILFLSIGYIVSSILRRL